MKKYAFTKETLVFKGRLLKRIKALKDFGDVKKGELGGFIEGESNLSHEGGCWAYDSSKIYGTGLLCEWGKTHDNAEVFDDAIICNFGSAHNSSKICEQACISGNGTIYGNEQLSGCQECIEGSSIGPYTENSSYKPISLEEEPEPTEEALALRKSNKLFQKETYKIVPVFN